MSSLDKNTEKPCMTIISLYETFGGSGKYAYRTDIKKGVISFDEMESLDSGANIHGGSFEITEVTENTVSFIVNGRYLDSGKDEVHTIPLYNGVAVFQHIEERRGEIEGDTFDYEVSNTLKLCTAKRILNVRARVCKGNSTACDMTYKMLPYAPGAYELGDKYPFSKNVYTGPDTGYYFGRLYVGEDLSIRYLDEDPRPAITPERGHVFERKFGDESIMISVTEESFAEVIGDHII